MEGTCIIMSDPNSGRGAITYLQVVEQYTGYSVFDMQRQQRMLNDDDFS